MPSEIKGGDERKSCGPPSGIKVEAAEEEDRDRPHLNGELTSGPEHSSSPSLSTLACVSYERIASLPLPRSSTICWSMVAGSTTTLPSEAFRTAVPKERAASSAHRRRTIRNEATILAFPVPE